MRRSRTGSTIGVAHATKMTACLSIIIGLRAAPQLDAASFIGGPLGFVEEAVDVRIRIPRVVPRFARIVTAKHLAEVRPRVGGERSHHEVRPGHRRRLELFHLADEHADRRRVSHFHVDAHVAERGLEEQPQLAALLFLLIDEAFHVEAVGDPGLGQQPFRRGDVALELRPSRVMTVNPGARKPFGVVAEP